MLIVHSRCLKVIGNTRQHATSAIYSMLFITMTSSYSYLMTISTVLGLKKGSKQSGQGVFNAKVTTAVAIGIKETEELLNLA